MSPQRKQRYSESYRRFFKSERWRLLRINVLWRDCQKCQICGVKMTKDTRLDIHHYYYPINPYDITEAGLVALCRPCHKIADKERLTHPDKRYSLSKKVVV